MARTRDEGDVGGLIDLNNRFHQFIAQRSGSQRLSEMLEDLRGQLRRLEVWFYSQQSRAEESVAEHDEMIRAIEAGDHGRALDLLEHNMALTHRRLAEEQPAQGEPARG
jgi:DNA-binding GntR family transcriptional regulator